MSTATWSGQGNRTDPFYLSPKWQRLRKMVIVAAKYTDQIRIRQNVMIEANTVHHIFPREQYPEYQWARWNLIAISDETHKHLHKPDGTLSTAGRKLQEETAEQYGIPISKTILIIGKPGSGKSTRAKQLLGGGICYDLDAIAGALRLRGPHEEDHAASRRMAQGMARYFEASARKYSGRVLIIRTAPTIDEVVEIDPDDVIICTRSSGRIERNKATAAELDLMEKKIEAVKEWAESAGLETETYPPQGPA